MPLGRTWLSVSNQSNAAPSEPVPTDSSLLTEQDKNILRYIEPSLDQALELRRWWTNKEVAKDYAQQFELIQTFNRPNRGTGFFDIATVKGANLPVMGVIQEMLYDRADTGAANVIGDICAQFQEFVLAYFTRISSFRQPQAYVKPTPETTASHWNPLSWCMRPEEIVQGFGFSQHYYKLKESGRVGKFSQEQLYRAIDLREVGATYEWVVLRVEIYDFNLTFRPFGPQLPSIAVPLQEQTYVILHKDFISNQKTPQDKEVLGRYGFGYGLLRVDEPNSLLAYGPGRFKAGFQTIDFRLLPNGVTDVQLVFTVNRPDKLLNVPINPLTLGFALADIFSFGSATRIFQPLKEALQAFSPTLGTFDPILTYVWLANTVTMGQAARQFCISKEQLEKEMLVQHYMQHYQMILSSLLTWRFIPDWLDTANLPAWIINGINP